MPSLISLALVLGLASAQVLETFDGEHSWSETNDPVMGGQSTATFAVADGKGVFNGTCKIVPSLQAPGFCSAQTRALQWPDASANLAGGLAITATTTTPECETRAAIRVASTPRPRRADATTPRRRRANAVDAAAETRQRC